MSKFTTAIPAAQEQDAAFIPTTASLVNVPMQQAFVSAAYLARRDVLMGLDYKDEGEEFQAGYKAALEAVAVSFGIVESVMQARPQYRIVPRETPRLTSGEWQVLR